MIEATVTKYEGIYELSEASRYLYNDLRVSYVKPKISSAHLIRWIHYGLSDPALVKVPGRQLLITFEDLISMRVISFLRALDYSFPKIRRAEKLLRKMTGHSRPFATEPIWAEKKGAINIFSEIASVLMVASKGGQLPFIDMVRDDLINMHGLTFDDKGIAYSWSPRSNILLHSKIQFGRPCIMGTRIPTNDIAGMVAAGDSMQFLSDCYEIPLEYIKSAVEWERELVTTS